MFNVQKEVFFISGLGVDRRAFQSIKLHDGFKATHIDWFLPEEEDTMASYAEKIIDKFNIDQDSIVVGLSFGGMLASQIGSMITNKKTILISSCATHRDFPAWFYLFGGLNIPQMLPLSIMNKPTMFTSYFFGIKNPDHEKQLKEIIRDSNPYFVKWALQAIMNWRLYETSPYMIRIHGTEDRILPYKGKVDYTINNGTHFMVHSRAFEINQIINQELKQLFASS